MGGVDQVNRIGAFLRARRERVTPEDAGLPAGPGRRVAGLRREEVARLAGISADYYERLERGRDRHPSTQVLDALARALLLDADAAAHLHRLATFHPRRRRAPGPPERVPAGVQGLIDQWTTTPSFVWGRRMDVLAANPLAVALTPMYRPGGNLVRAFFLDPDVRRLHPAWERLAGPVAATLRTLATEDDDGDLHELVEEVSAQSEEFRRLWARHDARRTTGAPKRFHHPVAGDLDLRREAMALHGADRQTLVVYHAEPGTASEEALRRLAPQGRGPRTSEEIPVRDRP